MNNKFCELIFQSGQSKVSLHEFDYVFDWIENLKDKTKVNVEIISLQDLKQWSFDDELGKIKHQSNKFFSIEGIEVDTNWGNVNNWRQPIINQPEIGILGILCKIINGVLHFLIQAKIEPGNINIIQLSPTVQATKSNFTKVHNGHVPKFLEYFQNINKNNLIIDQLQSEQGARFLKKRNRNLVVYAEISEIPDEFIWLTLNQIKKLLKIPNLVNMDTRTVLSGFYPNIAELTQRFDYDSLSVFGRSLLRSAESDEGVINTLFEVSSFMADQKFQFDLFTRNCNLLNLGEWIYDEKKIYHRDNKFFEVIGVNVLIENREVTNWTQPMIRPCRPGICAFILKEIGGIIYLLVQSKIECGNLDIIEFAPTVQCITGDYNDPSYEVPYLDYILHSDNGKMVLFDNYLSEEGGRFYHDVNRNIVVLAGDEFDHNLPERYIWLTLNQVHSLLRFNNIFNIQARSLISSFVYE
jgi:oxidase EvaA